ncbi:chromatin remodeling complex subunit [Pyrenophora seminiperda CCB06]|uniref:Chromatin remodeling complex subunit n=1 Tax=Pyrenophora seminiperda CCB06 TaxID=1302712 RepID=A0A3M7MB03_9PLEO|nr:chromatin remodeling complex subunit [Pyrenophora seminiperda CCB06]
MWAMPPFKEDQIIIIAPGSETTLAQLGLPESFTPASLRVRSRMFPAEKQGEFEPYKIRRKQDKPAVTNDDAQDESQQENKPAEGDDEVVWEEDRVSEEGAIWPIQQGRIVDWPCFFALITHVYNSLNPPFHTPILLVTQPAWTPREHEKITQFFFEKFKVPAFNLIDSALATTWAYGVHTATVVDVGKDKADITAVSEFIPHTQGRVISLAGCGGEAFTQGLLDKLKSKGLNRDMCEQLKRSPICELLPPGTPLPASGDAPTKDTITNPAAAASTGAPGSGPAAAATIGIVPRGPGVDTEVGEDTLLEENEGVLDVASIVAGGKINSAKRTGAIRREIEVGTERFMADGNGTLEKIADAIHRAISSIDEVGKRSDLWDQLIVCGNGSKLRGFKESLLQTIQTKYLVSPSSATIFTSEIPSNVSTPTGTGANTPQPQLGPHGGSQVNPLLLAATTAQTQHMMPPGGMHGMSQNTHSSHGQTPTSIKFVKAPEYFPEFKDVGFDESPFLGAQVAAKVLFVVDQGQSKGYMTRPDYNDQGPQGIHDYSL